MVYIAPGENASTAHHTSDYIPSALPSTGKHYWEIKVNNVGTYHVFGVTDHGGNAPGNDGYNDNILVSIIMVILHSSLLKRHNGASTADQDNSWCSSGVNFSNNDIIMFALDADSNKMWIGRNGTWYHGDPWSRN